MSKAAGGTSAAGAVGSKDLGAWEKHTKGIGLKYLQKFGFKGRLGAKEDGVSRAIEVVVRPSNQGLGFGDTAEASTLKVNKKIEAEWRGLDFVDDEEEDVKTGRKRKKSSIELMADSKSWKKHGGDASKAAFGASGARAQHKMESFSAEDFINKYINTEDSRDAANGTAHGGGEFPKQVVIDMRHKDTRIITDMHDISSSMDPELAHDAAISAAGTGPNHDHPASTVGFVKAKVGQELLYNVNTIADLEDMQVHKDSRKLARLTSRVQSLDAEIEQLHSSENQEAARLTRLQKIAEILKRIDSKLTINPTEDSDNGNGNGDKGGAENGNSDITIASVCSLFQTLHSNFEQEFAVFGLINMLPFLLCRVIKADNWNPSVDHAYLFEISEAVKPLIAYFEQHGFPAFAKQTQAAFCSLLEKRFLPAVRRYVTSQWKAEEDPDTCVRMFECLQVVLPAALFEDTLDVIVIPKLSTAVSTWKPVFDTTTSGLKDSSTVVNGITPAAKMSEAPMIHTWLHPWLPLMASKLSVFYPEIRRKFSTALSSPNWHPRLSQSAIRLLKPWKHVFDAASMENLLVRAVVPKLVRLLQEEVVVNPTQQDVLPIQWILCWSPLVPSVHMTSLLIGEFFPQWLTVLHCWLSAVGDDNDAANLEEVVAWYRGWKSLFPVSLLQDEVFVQQFDAALDVMLARLYDDRNSDSSDSSNGSDVAMKQVSQYIEKLRREGSYYNVIETRKSVQRAQARLQAIEEEERRQQHAQTAAYDAPRQSHHASMSFKEMVDAFAQQHGVEFGPRIGKFHEGKQVWQFGKSLCVIDQNVIFMQQQQHKHQQASQQQQQQGPRMSSVWLPVSLEELLASSL